MEAYVTALREEIKDRGKLIDLLEQGSVFYDHQKGEAKIVVNVSLIPSLSLSDLI
jgi:hypothetical protein